MTIPEKASGILLHITSLPGSQGIGTLGKEAFNYIDFLSDAEQKIWQILPTGPTGYGDSPYQTFSAFAGNPLLIDLEDLVRDNLLKQEDLASLHTLPSEQIDFGRLIPEKNRILRKAFSNFIFSPAVDEFIHDKSVWLDDYALFMALKTRFSGKPWSDWEHSLKFKDDQALNSARKELSDEINYQKFLQFYFFRQWQKLKNYATRKNILIFGDLPIFIALDSADAWSKPELFQFDSNLDPVVVAGVPPDFFSSTGQLWGNPLYDWQEMEKQDFSWWLQRINSTLEQIDLIRIDHFRGFAGYWAVPFGSPTAEHGSWEPAPGMKLFKNLKAKLPNLPIIAEDLGVITDDVVELRDAFDFPGMKILQFAFGSGANNPFLPENFNENCVVYTGTHDNDTTRGWYEKIPDHEKEFLIKYLDGEVEDICWQLIELGWNSKARIAIAPLQDFLCLGSEARMNIPGKPGGNWQWRIKAGQLNHSLADAIREITVKSNR